MTLILDTDILSMFAKADAISVLKALFGEMNLAITPGIEEEISIPLDYGYKFPSRALLEVKIIPITEEALLEYNRLLKGVRSLGKGELEAIATCRVNGYIFATNDFVARKFAKTEGVHVVSLQSIMRALWKSEIKTKEEVKKLLNKIEKSDNLTISKKIEKEIFKE